MPAPYRFDINVGNGDIEFVNAASSETEYLINLYTVVDVAAHVKTVRVYGLADGDSPFLPTNSIWSTVSNDATMLQDAWPEPTTANIENTQIGRRPPQQHFVRLRFNDQRFMDIPMGQVANQATWTNDTTGASACVDAIRGAIRMP
jgi:hypothetical protein